MLTRASVYGHMLYHRITVRTRPLRASLPARFVQKFMDDRVLTLASLLAWGMLNTFLPLLLGIFALLGLALGDSPQAAEVESRLLAVLPAEISALIRETLEAIDQAAGGAGLISLGLLLFNGSNFFVSLATTFNQAYHVPDRPLIQQRLISVAALFAVTGIALMSSVFALASSVVGQYLVTFIPELAPIIDQGSGTAISLVGLLVVLLLAYRMLPNARLSIRDCVPGILVAALLFVAVLRLFPLYVALFGGGFSVYAAFGSVLLFMFWLYLLGVVLIGGAELNAFLKDPERSVLLSSLAAQALRGQLEPAAVSVPVE